MNLDNVIDKINYVLDKIMDFYSWICLETGLEQWQLFVIGLAILVLLMLFLRHLRKTRIKKIHTIQSKDRVEIIGTRLSRQQSKQRAPENFKKRKADFAPEQDEQHSWGQTTKDWRQLREKIRHLEREITKYQRTEKHLNEQITELKNSKTDLKNINEQLNQLKNTNAELKNNNEQLQLEINEHVKIAEDLKKHINKLKTAGIEQIQKETIQNQNTISSEPELKVSQKLLDVKHEEQSMESDKEIKQNTVEQQTENNEQQEKPESPQIIDETQQIPPEQEILNKDIQVQNMEIQDNSVQETLKEDVAKQQQDKSAIDRCVDIKELQAIADLAKRLQDRGQQQQNK